MILALYVKDNDKVDLHMNEYSSYASKSVHCSLFNIDKNLKQQQSTCHLTKYSSNLLTLHQWTSALSVKMNLWKMDFKKAERTLENSVREVRYICIQYAHWSTLPTS